MRVLLLFLTLYQLDNLCHYIHSDSDLSLNDDYPEKGGKAGPTPSDSGDEYTDDEYTDDEDEELKKPLKTPTGEQYVDRVEKFTQPPAPGAPVPGYQPVPVSDHLFVYNMLNWALEILLKCFNEGTTTGSVNRAFLLLNLSSGYKKYTFETSRQGADIYWYNKISPLLLIALCLQFLVAHC